MVKVEDIQNYGKEHLESVAASASNVQSGVQAIASAYGDYAKKSFEDTKSFVEKLSGVKSLDKAIEAQTEFARSSYETFVAEVAEDRRPLHRSRQADLQALRRPGREVHPGRALTSRGLPRTKKARPSWPGFFVGGLANFLPRISARNYRATRSFESEVPMVLKAAMIWVAEVTVENFSAAGAILQHGGGRVVAGVHVHRVDGDAVGFDVVAQDSLAGVDLAVELDLAVAVGRPAILGIQTVGHHDQHLLCSSSRPREAH